LNRANTSTALLAGQPALLKTLSESSGYTLVAPSNDAFTKFLAVPANKAAAADPNTLMQVLSGVFPASAFTTTQQFIPTMLMAASNSTNSTMVARRSMNMTSSLTSVTGGQVVGGQVVGKTVMIMSGLRAMSVVQTAVRTNFSISLGSAT
jgi:transforming growth factor-beta-induced protein